MVTSPVAGDLDARTVQAILDKLDVLARTVDRLDERLVRLERNMDAAQQQASSSSSRLDALDRKVTATILNGPSRSINGIIMHDVVTLAPVLSVLTGEPMDGFPETLADLDCLEEPVVDRLLTHLGQPLDGGFGTSIDAKRSHLGHAIGVVLRAV